MASSRRYPVSYNISTCGPSGGGYDYQPDEIGAWELDTDTDLVSAGKGEVLRCYHDDYWKIGNITFSGATTNASYFRVIDVAEGHKAYVYGNGEGAQLRLWYSSVQKYFDIRENGFGLYDLFIKGENADAGSSTMSAVQIDADYVRIVGVIIRYIYNSYYYFGTSGIGYGVRASDTANDYVIANCFFKDTEGDAILTYKALNAAVYNCTFCSIGRDALDNEGSDYIEAKNLLFYDIGESNFEGNINTTSAQTLSSDIFNNSAEGDLRLTEAVNTGTDLSGDSLFAFDDDIEGEVRLLWHVGGDDFYTLTTGTRTANLDALLQKAGITRGASMDALLKATGQTVVNDLDALLQKTQATQAELDALLEKPGNTRTAEIDALIEQAGLFQNTSLDGLLEQAQAIQASMDAILEPSSVEVPVQLDALLARFGLLVETALDACLQAGRSGSAHLDALVQISKTLNAAMDALLEKTGQAAASLDARLVGTATVQALMDAVLTAQKQVTSRIDAVVTVEYTEMILIDGILVVFEAPASGDRIVEYGIFDRSVPYDPDRLAIVGPADRAAACPTAERTAGDRVRDRTATYYPKNRKVLDT